MQQVVVSAGFHLLDDNVVRTADDTETLALDDTGAAGANDGLVGLDGYAEGTGVVAERSVSMDFWGFIERKEFGGFGVAYYLTEVEGASGS